MTEQEQAEEKHRQDWIEAEYETMGWDKPTRVEEVREAIARELFTITHPFTELIEENYYRKWKDDVDPILSLKDKDGKPMLGIVSDDQTAPVTELEENSTKGVITQDYLNGRKSIIDANFRRVIILEE